MRDLKFRGKSLYNEEWVYGDSIYGVGMQYSNSYTLLNQQCLPTDCDSLDRYKVDSSTVSQFTGLTDRHGKEIYEGDIITVNGRYPHVILWDKMSWAIMPCELYNDKHFWVMNLQHPGNDWWEEFSDEMEVIGNIHDNPELLKGRYKKAFGTDLFEKRSK